MAQKPPSDLPPSAAQKDRRAAESPPGSSARADSDVSGWSAERDESPEAREERLQRAARMHMATPRTDAPAAGEAAGSAYGRDDRALGDATGRGEGPRAGDQDWDLTQQAGRPPREPRSWDRRGSGSEGDGKGEP